MVAIGLKTELSPSTYVQNYLIDQKQMFSQTTKASDDKPVEKESMFHKKTS
jgi:hypothetical protein